MGRIWTNLTMIDAIAWVHIQNRKLLCVRTRGKDAFYLPGGKRELGETDPDTLLREVKEELGVTLDPKTICWLQTYTAAAHGYGPTAQVTMACYRAEFVGTITATGEIAELAWFDSRSRDRCAPVNQIVIDDLVQRGWID